MSRDDTPTMPLSQRILLRDATGGNEEPTQECCPRCAKPDGTPGDGLIRWASNGIERARKCIVCDGNGMVSPARASEYRLAPEWIKHCL